MSAHPRTQSQLDLAAVDYRLALQHRDASLAKIEALNAQYAIVRQELDTAQAAVMAMLTALTTAATAERCEDVAS